MKYMLDTNICIYLIKNKPIQILERFKAVNINDICISSITLSELDYGVEKSLHLEKNREALHTFIMNIGVLDYGMNAALCYGKIRTLLEKKGTPIGAYDMMIAAHALSLDLILITNNMREFERIDRLKLENWV